MKKSDLTYIVGCAFTAAVSIFYCCIIHFKITIPRYYPNLHKWMWFDKIEGEPSQGWYGMQGFSFIVGGIIALAAYIACKKAGAGKQIELKPVTVKGTALATITVVLLAMAYIMQHEFHRWGTI
jgi:hypothetical protein